MGPELAHGFDWYINDLKAEHASIWPLVFLTEALAVVLVLLSLIWCVQALGAFVLDALGVLALLGADLPARAAIAGLGAGLPVRRRARSWRQAPARTRRAACRRTGPLAGARRRLGARAAILRLRVSARRRDTGPYVREARLRAGYGRVGVRGDDRNV